MVAWPVLHRPRGKSSIIVPSGGADCSAWLAFRSALARIEAQTVERPPVQVPGSFPATLPPLAVQSEARMPYHPDWLLSEQQAETLVHCWRSLGGCTCAAAWLSAAGIIGLLLSWCLTAACCCMRAPQLQLKQLTELESHLATLGAAIPDLTATSGYLEALSISTRPVQARACLLPNAAGPSQS
jgi:hypothetical protein